MALILIGTAAYGAYVASQQMGKGELEIDFEGKTSVTLLPAEISLAYLETPLSTITYCDGDYKVAATHLMERVTAIIALNPWLGGWVGKAKGTQDEIKLWYDKSGKDVAFGTFYLFAPGEVPFLDGTPYAEYEKIGKEQNLRRTVRVPKTSDVLGTNEALWRVSIVPTTDKPDSRFVIVVSMSRLLGDPYTFYMLYSMLSRDMEPMRMDPVRRLEYPEAIVNHVGENEAFFIKKVTSNPRWDWTKTGDDPSERLIFIISEKWLEEQQGHVPADATEEERNTAIDALVTSWFFNTLRPTLGLKAFDYRNAPFTHLNALNAGNYVDMVLYTPVDYATPELIQESMENQRRCGSVPLEPLPATSWDATFAATTNWSSYHWDPLDVSEDVKVRMHLPLFKGGMVIPNKLSLLTLFAAHAGSEDGSAKRQLGAFVIAPRSGIAKIVGSGIVGEVITKF